jgi:formamidopyrimidine-DNA glycosylase
VPELPEVQALAERLDAAFAGARVAGIDALGFSGLKTVLPPPETLVGREITGVGRRGKYLVMDLGGPRVLVHLSQAGRLDVEEQAKKTRPKGAVMRMRFDDGRALLVREHGTERKAGWWVLAEGDDGPLEKLGPEPGTDAFDDVIRTATDRRRVHTVLRDQRTVSGVGRGYADDALHRAGISPTATLASLSAEQRETLVGALHEILDAALEGERRREGGLSAAKLGDRFSVHGRHGQPCPVCGEGLRRISYESYEITYCPKCQTRGKVLADRRLSRLVK